MKTDTHENFDKDAQVNDVWAGPNGGHIRFLRKPEYGQVVSADLFLVDGLKPKDGDRVPDYALHRIGEQYQDFPTETMMLTYPPEDTTIIRDDGDKFILAKGKTKNRRPVF